MGEFMKAIIKLKNPSKERLLKAINHLLKYGYSDFIVFSTFFRDIENEIREEMWQKDAKIVFLKSYNQSTEDCLLNIKGSLTDRFLLVYNDEICQFDLKNALNSHHNSTMTATILYAENKTTAVFFETEIFDYIPLAGNFEREVIPRIFEDHEVQIYPCIL